MFKDMFDVYKMEDISPKTRARIIIKLGEAINYDYASNISEPIVCELVFLLDRSNEIFEKEHYQKHMTQEMVNYLS